MAALNEGRVVLITGAGRGIGREHALAYAATSFGTSALHNVWVT